MKILFVFAFLLSSLFCAAQTKYVQKLYAYNEKQDSKTAHFIYIELAPGVTPIWDTAIIEGDLFAVHSSVVETIPLQLGERKSDKRMVVIRPQPGYKLWQLEFDLIEENTRLSIGATPEAAAVLLKGTYKGRQITYTVRKEVELVPRVSF